MSFDMFVMFFRNSEPRKVRRSEIARIFGGIVDTDDDSGSWNVPNSHATLTVGDRDEIECLGINRPPSDEHPFWPTLVTFLDQTHGVLFWPGGGQVVTDESAVPHLSREMEEIFGPPIVTRSVDRMLQAIEG